MARVGGPPGNGSGAVPRQFAHFPPRLWHFSWVSSAASTRCRLLHPPPPSLLLPLTLRSGRDSGPEQPHTQARGFTTLRDEEKVQENVLKYKYRDSGFLYFCPRVGRKEIQQFKIIEICTLVKVFKLKSAFLNNNDNKRTEI